jgi:hypothetical protein
MYSLTFKIKIKIVVFLGCYFKLFENIQPSHLNPTEKVIL